MSDPIRKLRDLFRDERAADHDHEWCSTLQPPVPPFGWPRRRSPAPPPPSDPAPAPPADLRAAGREENEQ
jgi:hypothetical protein